MQMPESTTPVTEDTVKEQTPSEPTEATPEIQAAMFLQGALPAFRRNLENLTGVQAKRVLSALMEAPLEKETPGFTTKEAEELFTLGLMISNAKFILFNVALKDNELASKVEQEAKAAGEEAAVSQETKGE